MQFYHTAQSFKSPGDHRLRVTAPAQDLHIQPLNLQVGLRPATQTAAAAVGLHIQKNFAQTVRGRLREGHLHARGPCRGLHQTAVCCS